MRRHGRIALALVGSVGLTVAGCATAPPADPPSLAIAVPSEWGGSTASSEGVVAEWWTAFGDPMLTTIVEATIAHNHDLQAAVTRLDQAAATARIAGADLQPSVTAGFNAARRRQNFIGLPIPGREGGVLSSRSTTLGVAVDTTWEADLWGRLRAGTRAALADLQSTAATLRGAYLSITGQAAKTWFAIAAAQQQVRLAEQTVESFQRSTDQVRDRFERGIRSSLDLRLSLANLASAQAALQARLQQRDAATRQLEVLVGRYPDSSLTTPTRLPEPPAAVPGGLPADLVGRRPDLIAAERRIAASNERLTVSRRDLYPRLSLTASGGTSTQDLQNLLNQDFSVWSLVGGLVQPLFQGGRLRAAVDRSTATVEEAVAAYAQTALTAYAEVESALAAETFLAGREEFLRTAAEQSRAAERLAEDRYRSGLEDFITVLEAQRRAFTADSALIQERRLRLENRVDLHLALGGGFEALESLSQAPPLVTTAEPGMTPGMKKDAQP